MGTDEYICKELSEDIVGAAMTVLNQLRPGLKEKAHENALAIELKKRGHQIEQQRSFDVLHDGVVVDTLVPDLIAGGKVIVDPKCVTDFNEAKLRWKRVIR
jgi:GxxExxY protein